MPASLSVHEKEFAYLLSECFTVCSHGMAPRDAYDESQQLELCSLLQSTDQTTSQKTQLPGGIPDPESIQHSGQWLNDDGSSQDCIAARAGALSIQVH